ncbi:ATP-dependent Clp protease ATP-binding subunit [Allostreptomyces psammosilenae]|uniref:ATP-dependent Clp protease ATP-binding subunit ClpC n=1 Tax=Allostreptomyces psammosilenae TaxID=1892865 RepID=A0A852ZTK5_9ACTN|nr:ATP-dependent Clp protease ATP-binding subunit [Allostreptomyces psammosilenae]NYI04877.1 ATP-dependent Clp protease ATP-binding subunit ClpC [Allostreptomyces psammosilenae]
MSSSFNEPSGTGGESFDDFLARFFGGASRRPVQRVDIGRFMSEQARALVSRAASHAVRCGSKDLDTDNLLWAALQLETTARLVAATGADPRAIAGKLDPGRPGGEEGTSTSVALTPAAKRALLDSHRIAQALGSSYIGPEHILFALASNPDSTAGRLLSGAQVTPEALQQAATGRPAPTVEPRGPSATPTVNQFGRDLTELAREGAIDPVVGRDEEIDQTVEVLSRRTKNNPVLIGEAGVGKTAIVEGIAQRIANGEVPETIADKRVMQLDLSGVVAGTRYRGDFEERMKKLIDEMREHADELIVFIDELHTMVGAGSGGQEGGMDAGNMLKPALSRGEVHVIGATTLDEYRRGIEKDAALARRFQPILVAEPSVDDAVEILHGLRDRYEAHHQVRITDAALLAAVELSDRYITDRFLPDKAIDLVDQAGARVRLRTLTPGGDVRRLERDLERLRRDKDQAVADEQYERASRLRDSIREVEEQLDRSRHGTEGTGAVPKVPEVTMEDVAEVVSRTTGIPVNQITEEEKERLLHLEERLRSRVVGQEDAVAAVAEAVRRNRAGLGDPDRPIGSFLFLGPTGVGKTELARALSEALFGSEERMIRLDMSEFQERHTVSRMVGAPPGYVGYEEAGQLTEAVRRRPYSVVLLDEIEKAHPDVFNILLQVLDDGRLTDSQGRTVDFRHTVLIMTSNIGSELILGGGGALGFAPGGAETPARGRADAGLRDRLMRRLRDSFRPEFLNRIDEIIVFHQLRAGELRQVTDLLLDETRRRARAQGLELEFTPAAIDLLAEQGHQPEFGARPLRRTIQREVDNRLSRLLLDGRLGRGQHVVVDVRGGELTVEPTISV